MAIDEVAWCLQLGALVGMDKTSFQGILHVQVTPEIGKSQKKKRGSEKKIDHKHADDKATWLSMVVHENGSFSCQKNSARKRLRGSQKGRTACSAELSSRNSNNNAPSAGLVDGPDCAESLAPSAEKTRAGWAGSWACLVCKEALTTPCGMVCVCTIDSPQPTAGRVGHVFCSSPFHETRPSLLWRERLANPAHKILPVSRVEWLPVGLAVIGGATEQGPCRPPIHWPIGVPAASCQRRDLVWRRALCGGAPKLLSATTSGCALPARSGSYFPKFTQFRDLPAAPSPGGWRRGLAPKPATEEPHTFEIKVV